LDCEERSGADDPGLTLMLLAFVGAGSVGKDLVATLSARRYCIGWELWPAVRGGHHRTIHVAQETTRTNVPVAHLDHPAAVQGLEIW
jgi:hypothetical protein